jgi:aminomethyltransferase
MAAQFVPGLLGEGVGQASSPSDRQDAGATDAGPGIKPAGLGARDTLRLEAALPLYGHELDDKIDSLSAGQAWCVDLKKDFIGVEALRRIAEAGSDYKLVGLELAGRRIARQGAKISSGNDVIGRVTSGTLSPTLGKSIAMGYVQCAHCAPGKKLSIDIGGQPVEASIVPLPFYKRS